MSKILKKNFKYHGQIFRFVGNLKNNVKGCNFKECCTICDILIPHKLQFLLAKSVLG